MFVGLELLLTGYLWNISNKGGNERKLEITYFQSNVIILNICIVNNEYYYYYEIWEWRYQRVQLILDKGVKFKLNNPENLLVT